MIDFKNKYVLLGVFSIVIIIITLIYLSKEANTKEQFTQLPSSISTTATNPINITELQSPNGLMQLKIDQVGDFIVSKSVNDSTCSNCLVKIWSARDAYANNFKIAQGPFRLTLQTDGNLVIYGQSSYIFSIADTPQWSRPSISAPYTLTLTDTGSLEVKDSQNRITWKSVIPVIVTPPPPPTGVKFRYIRIAKDIKQWINYNTIDDLLEISKIALINKDNTRYNHNDMKFVASSVAVYGNISDIDIRGNTSNKFFASKQGKIILDLGQEVDSINFSKLDITTGNVADNNTKSRINGVTVLLIDKYGKPINNGVPLIYNRTTNSPTVSLSMDLNSAQFLGLVAPCNPSKAGNCMLGFSELQVFNSSNQNIALTRPHLMTKSLPSVNASFSSLYAVDGDLTNIAHSDNNMGGMFVVDLGFDTNISSIDHVTLYNRFEGSDDEMMRQEGMNISFINLVKGTNIDNTYQVIPASDVTTLFYKLPKPEINEILISSRSVSTALNLSELAIYTDDNNRLVQDANVNFQSLGGRWDANFDVANVYDGNINTTFHTQSGNTNPVLKITFPARKDIKRIVFDNRKDCCRDRVSNGGKIDVKGPSGFNFTYKFGNLWLQPTADRFTYSIDFLNGRNIIRDFPINNQKFLVKDIIKNKCVDDRGATTGGQQLYVTTCSNTNINQQWTYDEKTGLIKNANKNLCWDDGGSTASGTLRATTQPCDPNNKNQQWAYSTRTRQFYNPNKFGNMCLDDTDGSFMHLFTCDLSNVNQRFDIVKL